MLARQFPALTAALTKLGEEHAVVARLQEEIQQLADGYVPGESDPTRLRDATSNAWPPILKPTSHTRSRRSSRPSTP
jgi:hypothetical protein